MVKKRKNIVLSKLARVRESEGLTPTKLAQNAGIAPLTLRKAERGDKSIKSVTWNMILKGLNSLPNKDKKYTLEDIR